MNATKDGKAIAFKTTLVVGILLLIAAAHAFRLGTYFDGKLYIWYYSYFSDILLPFGMYFILCLNDRSIPILRGWRTKSLLVFGAATATEIAQAFGIYMLGVTFDPLDIVMFALGVLLAAFVDRMVLTRFVPSWSLD